MKLDITVHTMRGRKDVVMVSLHPGVLKALGFTPGQPLCAVVDRGVVILCRPEDFEIWGAVVADFPAAFITEPSVEHLDVEGGV